jgi:type II secretory pathway pseudopilin PulG
MRRHLSNEAGFTIVELMISTVITLGVLSVALTSFQSAVTLNQTGTQIADSTQNLRAGTNLMIRDLEQAARGIPTGGIPIPSGAGATAVTRPGPPGVSLTFDTVTQTSLPAITSGASLGPTIDGEATDIVTMLMTDTLPTGNGPNPGELLLNDGSAGQATLTGTGLSIDVGTHAAWMTGNAANGVPPIVAGDLLWVAHIANSSGTLVEVTSTDTQKIYLAAHDPMNLNQPGAAQGSIAQMLPPASGYAYRVLMITYYVDNITTPSVPRLTRRLNMYTPQALAGVVEDLNLTYDLVDGVTNPTLIPSLPYTANGVTYTANQIRKVNLHLGVRSDQLMASLHDYIRNHVNTVVSIRNLAYVNRYQ